jgi:hypothetical protein
MGSGTRERREGRRSIQKLQIPRTKHQRTAKSSIERILFSKYTRENKVQLFRLAVMAPRLIGQCRLGSRDHSKKELRFLCLLYATPNNTSKFLFGDSFICLAIIRADACAASHKLIDKPIVTRVTRNFLHKANDVFAKFRRSFLQVKRMSFSLVQICFIIQLKCSARNFWIFRITVTVVWRHWRLKLVISLALGCWSLEFHIQGANTVMLMGGR